jgi:subtilisin
MGSTDTWLRTSPPDYTIPPDFENPGKPPVSHLAASPWHFPADKWDNIRNTFGGAGIRVAVLDTGIARHPLLPTPAVMRSFIDGEAVTDGNGHGTHVAGSVAAGGGYGAAPKCILHIYKVLSNRGSGGSGGISAAIRIAADNGADIITMSLGGGGADRTTEQNIDYAWGKGCIVLAAAGNAGYNGSNTVGNPAKYRNCLCIGATKEDGGIAGFSSGGRELDIATPGQNILSTSNSGSGVVALSGTSMATPVAAGILANVSGAHRELGKPVWRSADEARSYFAPFVDDRGAPGKDVRFGAGVPNIDKIRESLESLANEVNNV